MIWVPLGEVSGLRNSSMGRKQGKEDVEAEPQSCVFQHPPSHQLWDLSSLSFLICKKGVRGAVPVSQVSWED
jgi:hypothetical protein